MKVSDLCVFISGVSSGPNPTPGVGVARSLRQAFPEAKLIGVDYSNRSSGLHWHDFDEVQINRPWRELDLTLLASQVTTDLDAGALWIPCLDLEARLLSRMVGTHPGLLAPSIDCYSLVEKPKIAAHVGLPVAIPPYIGIEASSWSLHTFGRLHGWDVWVKGPYYQAARAQTWRGVEVSARRLRETWGTEAFVQAHVTGHEESIAFAAQDGRLLDAVYMPKRELCDLGKTWAGEIREVPRDLREALKSVVRELGWTGGAELEMIVDAHETRWLIDWNPRFPAWIYGATLAGKNLPAVLVAEVAGVPLRQSQYVASQFTRVVVEVPVRDSVPLPPRLEAVPGGPSIGKHPSGMPDLARLLSREADRNRSRAKTSANPPSVKGASKGLSKVATELARYQGKTPRRVFLSGIAKERFSHFASAARGASTKKVQVRIAYSVKTNPDHRLIQCAREAGFLGEAISQREVAGLLRQGFETGEIVLNGPGKLNGVVSLETPLHAVFADSEEELEQLLTRALPLHYLGVRIKAPGSRSRFGLPLEDVNVFQRVAEALQSGDRLPPLGVHFHAASSAIGVKRWWQLLEAVTEWCHALEMSTGVAVRCLDIGGGWFPDDWDNEFAPRLAAVANDLRSRLTALEEIVVEPGKALAQPTAALVTTVVEVREGEGDEMECVVDASIAELPEARGYPHRLLWQDSDDGQWVVLREGADKIVGRLCMEDDIMHAACALPGGLVAGDRIAFMDAGGYDWSMSYAFGLGNVRDHAAGSNQCLE